MTEEAYVAASFLDARMLGPNPAIQVGRWGEVREATSALPEHCHFIFHVSHAGSTLLSRLVGYHESLFSLREAGDFAESGRSLPVARRTCLRLDCLEIRGPPVRIPEAMVAYVPPSTNGSHQSNQLRQRHGRLSVTASQHAPERF